MSYSVSFFPVQRDYKSWSYFWKNYRNPALVMAGIYLFLLFIFQVFSVGLETLHLAFEYRIDNSAEDGAEDGAFIGSVTGQSTYLFNPIQDVLSQSFDPVENTLSAVEYPLYNRYQTQPYVSNGYIGSRIPNVGHGFTVDQWDDGNNIDNVNNNANRLNGWPLFSERYSGAFVAGFYNIQPTVNKTNFPELYANGYESIISVIPQWTTLYLSVELNGKIYVNDPEKLQTNILDYSQVLSLNNGTVTTLYLWLNTLKVSYIVAAHRDESTLGIVLLDVQNIGKDPIDIKIEDNINYQTARRCMFGSIGYDDTGIYMSVHPNDLPATNTTLYLNLSILKGSKLIMNVKEEKLLVSQAFNHTLQPKHGIHVNKQIGIVSSDLFADTFLKAKEVAVQTSNLLQSHIDSWNKLSKLYNITFLDKLLTMAARSSLYHLSANTRSNAVGVSSALGVGGLSSDSYGGLVFWDSDLWMFGGLLPFAPEHSRSLVNYRWYTHEQAKKNNPSGIGAVYPWTSGRYGNCTSTGPCFDYEYHINVAVALAAWQSYLSGAVDDSFMEQIGNSIILDAADFLSVDIARYNSTYEEFTTHNLTDPDEYANHVDNGAYTNAGIQKVVLIAKVLSQHFDLKYNSRYDEILEKGMHIPNSSNEDNITLEFSSMTSEAVIKQADVIMITYPLENNVLSEEQALWNMRYYLLKQLSEGPAMTFPIYLLVSGKLLEEGCSSQSYLQKSVIPYIRGPFAQFLEQNNDDFNSNGGTNPAFPFLTAHGGFIQAILQGIIGLRFGYKIGNMNSALQNRQKHSIIRVLKLDPITLPLLGNYLKIDGVKYLNQTLLFLIENNSLIIQHNGPLDGALGSDINIEVAKRNPSAGNFVLKPNQDLILDLFSPEISLPRSISECGDAHVYNITSGVPGDVLWLINDGDNLTHWQALSAIEPAKFIVDLHYPKNITGGIINWGNRPASSYKIFSYPDISLNSIHFIKLDGFKEEFRNSTEISEPFSQEEYNSVVVVDRFNTTVFEKPFFSRFVLFEFEGTHDDFEIGAKVAEFKLI